MHYETIAGKNDVVAQHPADPQISLTGSIAQGNCKDRSFEINIRIEWIFAGVVDAIAREDHCTDIRIAIELVERMECGRHIRSRSRKIGLPVGCQLGTEGISLHVIGSLQFIS